MSIASLLVKTRRRKFAVVKSKKGIGYTLVKIKKSSVPMAIATQRKKVRKRERYLQWAKT